MGYCEAKFYCIERGWKPGTVFYKFQERFNRKPPYDWQHLPPHPPSDALRRWMRAQAIAYAKSQQRGAYR